MLVNPWLMLLVGVVIGWLLEWVIDFRFFRPRLIKGNAALAKVEDYDRLKARVNDHNKLIEELLERNVDLKHSHEEEVAKLREELTFAQVLATQRVIAEASGAELNEKIYAKAVTRDPLQRIAGVGPKFEELFWRAGVYRFCQIATLSAEEIQDIIKPESWQNLDPENWIREASRLAVGKGT